MTAPAVAAPAPAAPTTPQAGGAVPVLMYHAISDDPPPAARALSVTPRAFSAQMALLAEHGRTPLTAAELGGAWRGGGALPPRPVLITFDDGYEGVHRHALPVLAAHGLSATVFVSTGWLRGGPGPGGAPDTMLDWGQVRELAAVGLEIGGHSHSHPQLDQLTEGRLVTEVERCREITAEETGTAPASFAYPFGYSDRRVRRVVRAAGFTQALAVRNAQARRGQGPYALARLTVRRTTGIEEFGRLIEGKGVGRAFAVDRALTQGYALVRRARAATRAVRG